MKKTFFIPALILLLMCVYALSGCSGKGKTVIDLELFTVNAIGVYDNMVVYVSFVNVGSNNNLTIITERFPSKSSAYLVGKFQRDVVFRVKRLNVVDGFHFSFTLLGRRLVKFISRKLFIHHLHSKVGALRLGNAIHRVGENQTVRFLGCRSSCARLCCEY